MYVRKTQTLVDDIDHRVDSMKNNAVKQLATDVEVEIGSPLHAEIKLAIENSLWQDAPDLKDKMPDSWLPDEDVTAEFKAPDRRTVRHHFTDQTGSKIKIPPKFNRYRDVVIEETYWTPLIADWLDRQHNVEVEKQKLTDMYREISNQLISFMGKHASLNTAIKEMPELKLYVPDSYIEKLERQENRIKSKPKSPTTKDDVEVDVEALTRAAIAHRLTTADKV